MWTFTSTFCTKLQAGGGRISRSLPRQRRQRFHDGAARQAPGDPAAVSGAAALLQIVLESAEEASANYVERR
jgi:hypothetical protein